MDKQYKLRLLRLVVDSNTDWAGVDVMPDSQDTGEDYTLGADDIGIKDMDGFSEIAVAYNPLGEPVRVLGKHSKNYFTVQQLLNVALQGDYAPVPSMLLTANLKFNTDLLMDVHPRNVRLNLWSVEIPEQTGI